MLPLLRRIDRAIAWVEKGVLLLMVLAIVALPLAQIVLRAVGQGGFAWGHEVVRTLLLWVAFLGASLATAERRHITIDLVDRDISPATKAAFNIAVQGVAFGVVVYLARVGWTFIRIQREMGDTTAILQLPVWISLLIIPISLAVIGWRFALLIVEDATALRRREFGYLVGPEREGRLY